MMRLKSISLIPTFLIAIAALEANAQVLITEVQPNPTGSDNAEWIELHNTGAAAVDISLWTIADSGANARFYQFPQGSVLAADQVVIVTRQATAWIALALASTYPVLAPDFELAFQVDDPLITNLVAVSGTQDLALAQAGDAVFLRDSVGMLIDSMEYGPTDRPEVPGAPQTTIGAEGTSFVRVANTGSSLVDFTNSAVGANTPGTGFVPAANNPPAISNTVSVPRHVRVGDNITVTTLAVDTDPVTATLHQAVATSSTGPATAQYGSAPMGPTGNPGEFAVTFVPGAVPVTFHDSYVRYYVEASDGTTSVTNPSNATDAAANTAYFQRNVMPAAASALSEVRAQNAAEIPLWRNHSATIEAVALTRGVAFVNNRTNFFVQQGSDAIRVFATPLITETVQPGDLVRVVGMIDVFNGQRQIGEPELDVTIISSGNPIPESVHTIADILANGEALESQLVIIPNVTLVGQPANWPANGNATLDDGTGTVTVRVTSIVDLAGTAAPQGAFDMRGILGQFDASGIGGYQILPRDTNDVLMGTPIPDAGVSSDATIGQDTLAPPPDSGTTEEDSGTTDPDAGETEEDSGLIETDAGGGDDSGTTEMDAGRADSGSTGGDSGVITPPDSGVPTVDAGVRPDAGGTSGGREEDEGCGCSTTETQTQDYASLFALVFVAGLLVTRRTLRR